MAARSRLDPAAGVMLSALWVTGTGQLVLIIHHLAVDAVSWRILRDDLTTAWAQHRAGQPVALAVGGTSFRRWAALLAEHAHHPDVIDQAEVWQQIAATPAMLPAVDPVVDTYVSAGHLSVSLDAETTRLLLGAVPAAFHAGVQDILLIAFGLAWTEFLGADTTPIGVDVEGHGRHEDLADDVELSTTVGWFTTKYPIALTVDGVSWPQITAGAPVLGALVKAAKEQLRTTPKGWTYGVLRYLNPEIDLDKPDPPIGFNYLGRLGTSTAGPVEDWQIADSGRLYSDAVRAVVAMPLMHTVELNALTVDTDTGPRLRADWSWAPSALDYAAISRISRLWFEALSGICAHVSAGGGGFSPSDFAFTRLSQPQIETLEHTYRISDVLPLTPLQRGLLVYTSDPQGSMDPYVMQLDIALSGRVDHHRLHAAVQTVLTRHPHLGARFVYERLDEPVQVLITDPVIPWRFVDLSANGAPPGQRIEQVCAAERAAITDLADQCPLRAVLIRTGPEDHRLIVTNHHIVLDGWSLPILLREIVTAYSSQPLPAPVPYRRFITWLAGQDVQAAQHAWGDLFAGFETPTLVGPPQRLGFAARDVHTVQLPTHTSGALMELARAQHTTLNIVLQAAWAQLLSVVTGHHDVAFGTTVSGRPAELTSAESMVGLFINTVPVRATLTATSTAANLLAQLQAGHTHTLDHQHLPLADIHRLTGHDSLFDTLFVYENYPLDTAPQDAPELTITAVSGREFNHYPLTLQISPGPRLGVRVEYATEVFDPDTITTLIERLQQILAAMIAQPTRALSSIDLLSAQEHTHLDTVGNRAALTKTTVPKSIPELFTAQVTRTPDAVALVYRQQSCSYRGLDQAANRLAHLLAGHGVGPGEVVALLLPRGVEAITAILAVLKTGAAYLPIDPEYPDARIKFLLADASPKATLTTPELAGRLDGFDVLVVDVDDPAIDTQPNTAPPAPTPEDIAYLIYTSGSTGVPKGVAVSHAGIGDLVGTCVERLAITPRSRILQFAPLAFDVSVGNLWCALVERGCGGDSGRRAVVAG